MADPTQSLNHLEVNVDVGVRIVKELAQRTDGRWLPKTAKCFRSPPPLESTPSLKLL